MRALNTMMQSSMEKLKCRCQDLREREKLPQSEGERIQLEQAKLEVHTGLHGFISTCLSPSACLLSYHNVHCT